MNCPCYVLHVKKGAEDRETSIVKQFSILGLPFEWILEYDIPEITEEVLSHYKHHGTELQPEEISCCLKHFTAWEKIAASPAEGGFIFEDDALIDTARFKHIALQALSEFTADWHNLGHISFGEGCVMSVPWTQIKKGTMLYRAELVRAADSYWITKKTAQLRLQWLQQNGFCWPADHMINKIDNELDIPILWLEPTVVKQGSYCGLFGSIIQNTGRGNVLNKLTLTIKRIRRHYLYPLIGIDQRVLDNKLRSILQIEAHRVPRQRET